MHDVQSLAGSFLQQPRGRDGRWWRRLPDLRVPSAFQREGCLSAEVQALDEDGPPLVTAPGVTVAMMMAQSWREYSGRSCAGPFEGESHALFTDTSC